MFISFFILISLTFAVSGTWMISASFKTSLQREIEMGMSRNELYRTALQNAVSAVPADYFTKQNHSMKEIISSLQESLLEKGTDFFVYNKKKKTIFSSTKKTEDVSLLENVDKSHKIYQVCQKGENYYLRTVSYLFVTADMNGYYIETQTNLQEIFQKRDDMTKMYHYIVLIVLICCAVLSFVISYLLTYRVRALSVTAWAFAGGQMEERAKIRGTDEIAKLAIDFNQMADELQEKMEQLEEHVKSQEAFTAAFAHELKTPLTSIIGYAELLRSMSLSKEEELTAANYIFSQGKRLESLSYKLLELFVLQKGEISFLPVNVGEAIEEVKQITAQGLQKKEVILEASFDEAVLLLEKDLFISLLVNLVDNAAKASQAGGHIRLTGKCEENRYAITVRDEGKGIPESEIKNILEPFYMVDKSRSRKEGGAGLGMTLCAEIVRLHHAEWKIESKENEGTKITIWFSLEGEE
jgi:signal transduction histidine kinase